MPLIIIVAVGAAALIVVILAIAFVVPNHDDGAYNSQLAYGPTSAARPHGTTPCPELHLDRGRPNRKRTSGEAPASPHIARRYAGVAVGRAQHPGPIG